MHMAGAILDFHYNQKNLLPEYKHNRLHSACQNFYKTMGDIDSLETNNELERFVVIVKKNKEDFKTANDFLTYRYQK